jgi:hypothetical protein
MDARQRRHANLTANAPAPLIRNPIYFPSS